MIGAIIGDIIGSRTEFKPIKEKDFELFTKNSSFTDDTVLTIAVADFLMEGSLDKEVLIDKLKYYTKKYPDSGYGERYLNWAFSEDRKPYNSLGNGSAMRVSACGEIAKSIYEARFLARLSADVTHNHIEGVKGAEAVASAIYFAKEKKDKKFIKEYIESEFGYDLNRTVDEIRKDYSFDVTCMGSVPEAIICFLEGKDYIDVIRNAVSLGGDSDTQGAIAGSIAEQYYEIPKDIKEKAMSYLTDDLKDVVYRFEKKRY